MVSGGTLTFGHAKVLAGLVGKEAQQLGLARKAQEESLSVRQLEALVAGLAGGVVPGDALGPTRARPAYIRDLEERLSAAAGTRVWIRPGRARNTGKVVIEYYSLDDFDRIASMLGVAPGQV
jgi:ParB family chromosome partitioning protein